MDARLPAVFLAGLLLGFTAFALLPQGQEGKTCLNGSIETVFSPGVGEDFIDFIDSAEESVEVEMYVFSYTPLAEALSRAQERGVRVRVILESRISSKQNLETMSFLRSKGVEVKWGSLEYSLTHCKFAVVDGKKVFVGSTNWSYHAMRENRESAVFIEDVKVVQEFLKFFEEDWEAAGAGS